MGSERFCKGRGGFGGSGFPTGQYSDPDFPIMVVAMRMSSEEKMLFV